MPRKKIVAHKQVRIPLKFAMVDEKIAPIVQWLNGFDSVCTYYSCMGNFLKGQTDNISAYVVFTCLEQEDLMNIVHFSEIRGTVIEVEFYNNILRYMMRWRTRKDFNYFLDSVKDCQGETI